MTNACGASCETCGFKERCKGCAATCGNPFGGHCLTAQYLKVGNKEQFEAFEQTVMDEFNALGIPGMPKITHLTALPGFYVNLEYPIPGGGSVKFLNDNRIYLGTQVPCDFDELGTRGGRCFGLVADTGFLLVAEYGENGSSPELVVYKRR